MAMPASGEEDAAAADQPIGGGNEHDTLDWLTEEAVERERDASVARTKVAAEHMRIQEDSTTRINQKVAQSEAGDAATMGNTQAAEPGGNWLLASRPTSMGSAERSRGAVVVANELQRRQERLQRFEQRRQQVLEQERLSREQTAAALEAADARCARKQRERQVANDRRAFEAQQRRSEQQKVFRELRREQESEQDRASRSYYSQNNSKSISKLGSDSSVLSTMGRSRSAPSSLSGLDSSTIPDDDIYASILQSHISYDGILAKAEKFIAENERRTQAQRRKLLASSHSRGGIDDDDADRFRARKDAQKASLSRAATSSSAMPKIDKRMSRASGGLSSGGASLSGSLPRMSATWTSRRESCLKLAAEKFQQSQEKLMRDKAALEDHRVRMDMKLKEKAGDARDINSTWLQKADLAKTTRKKLQVRSGEELAQKQAAVAERLEQERLVREQQRVEIAVNRANQTEASQLRAHSIVEDRQGKSKSNLSRKDAAALEISAAKIKNFENNVTSPDDGEEARVRQRKESVQVEYLHQARQEAEKRHWRSLQVLVKQRRSMLDLARAARCDKPSNDQGPVEEEENSVHDDVPSPSEKTARPLSPKGCPTPADANLSELAEEEAALAAALLASGGSVDEESYSHMLSDEDELIKEVELRSTTKLGDGKKRSKKKVWKPN